MKKTKLLTSLMAFVLVLGLGACELPEEETSISSETETTTETDTGNETATSEESSEDETTSESNQEGGNTSETTSEGGTTSETTSEGDTSESTSDDDSTPEEEKEKNEIPFTLDESYFLGFEYNGTKYYATGETVTGYSHEGVVSTNIGLAVSMTLTKATGDNAYYLSFELNEETYYVCIITKDGYEDLQYVTEATPIYWDDTNKAFVNEADTYFLCYNSTYNCLWASDITSWINSSPIVTLYEIPEDWEPYVPSTTLQQANTLSDGEKYYIGALSDGDYHLATGTMAGSYNVTTTTDIDAACLYTATLDQSSGAWTLTNDSGQYIYFWVSGSFLDLGLSSASTVPNSGTKQFLWSAQDKTLYTTAVYKSGYPYSYFEYYKNNAQLAAYGATSLGNFSSPAYFYQMVSE